MKYVIALCVMVVVLAGGLVLWQKVAEAPHAVDGSTSGNPASPIAPLPTSTSPRQSEVPAPAEPVACSMEAKLCPDGSAVGRTGPNCEFAACPQSEAPAPTDKGAVTCTEAMRQVDACIEIYAPVCGQVEVQCIKAPCYPVPETFSNGCHACAQKNVRSYTEGACQVDTE